ncbi:MAG: CSLREA domain-containing protein [Chloroflexi bacterium]|nr:CSLREA domain-containing protein [Chloroflexota bacterium]
MTRSATMTSQTKIRDSQSGTEASAGYSGQRGQPAKASSPEDHLNIYSMADRATLKEGRGHPSTPSRVRFTFALLGAVLILGAFTAAAVAGSAGERPAPAAALAAFVVNSRADTSDANPGNGVCADAAGACTLRAALEEANARVGADTITFAPAVFPAAAPAAITPASDLPPLADLAGGTTIDGSGAGVIVDGRDDPALLFGFTLISNNNALQRVQIHRFPQDGVFIGGSGNTVAYCYIGVDAAGADRGNGGHGVDMQISAQTIVSNTVGPGNVIGFNAGDGVFVRGSGNVVKENYIGADAAGRNVGNAGDGVQVHALLAEEGANTVGPGNVIGFNRGDGVKIWGRGNVVRDNKIGADATGKNLGNDGNGVAIQAMTGVSGANNTIGPGNVIGFNKADGVIIWGSRNVVANNYIGADAGGKNLGNSWAGVRINSFAAPDGASNRVGPGNVIAFNDVGVYVDGDAADRNTITRNPIFQNTSLGIDLHAAADLWPGVTPNDPNDADAGPNDLLNFPVLAAVTTATARGSACAGCTVEVFVAAADASGHGQGRTFAGSAAATGAGQFNVALSGVRVGDDVTATATDAQGNTSEFSANVRAVAVGAIKRYLPLIRR